MIKYILLILFSCVLLQFPMDTQVAPNLNTQIIVTDLMRQEISCLAVNVYHEALGESQLGQLAVAFVTINRVKSKDFPKTICEVVYQKDKKRCQFSWYCIKKNATITNEELYNSILKLVTFVYLNHEHIEDPSEGALYYHANYVKPLWKQSKKTVVIGNHIFYRAI